MELKGQSTILSNIYTSIEQGSLPVSMLFCGPKGCGKHTLCSLLKEKLRCDLQDITEDLSFDFLLSLYEKQLFTLYIIDLSKLTQKEQNEILKFVEEPPTNCHIILLSNNINYVLSTIKNRCVCFQFQNYPKSILKEFLDGDEIILEFADTPGDVLQMSCQPINQIVEYCNKILDKIGFANYSNIFQIIKQINFKDNFELFDFSIFSQILYKLAFNRMRDNPNKKISDVYFETSKFYSNTSIPHINKQQLLENYLITLKGIMNDCL